jgi:hypothetical protein
MSQAPGVCLLLVKCGNAHCETDALPVSCYGKFLGMARQGPTVQKESYIGMLIYTPFCR